MTVSMNLSIKFGTDLHKRVQQAIEARRAMSARAMSDRHKTWRKMDEQAIAFMKETEHDSIRKQNKKSSGIVDYVSLEVPFSYGMMMTAHTYLSSVFMGRDPVQQFTGRHGETQQQVMAVEALMGYQYQVGRHAVPYYIWLYDALKYGVGVLGNFWDREEYTVSEIQEVNETFLGMDTGKTKKKRVIRNIKGYEGNRVYNIRPYKFFPDTRVPLSRLQDGEFCGWETEIGWHELVQGQQNGKYFNIEALKKHVKSSAAVSSEDGSPHIQWPDPNEQISSVPLDDVGFVSVLEMVVVVIPKAWGLGKSDRPEKWVFTVGAQRVIIGARPLGEYHNKFPFVVIEQEIEGYALFKHGLMEQSEPLNNVLTWLFNSHFYNVREALNNQFIYDPSRIYSADVLDTGPGKRIRLKPEAYGTDIKQSFQQIPVADVTSQHMRDFQGIMQIMEQHQGVNANVMGMINPGGRKTATEIRASSSSSANRLKTVAEYMSEMGHSFLSSIQLQSTQQHYRDEKMFKIMGDLQSQSPFMQVTPGSIAGMYDYVPIDGSQPIDRFAQANLWREMLAGMRQMPEVMQGFDMAGIFTWVAQLAGMRNIKQFRINMVPDAQIQQQAQQGNAVPVQPSGLDRLTRVPNINEPGQVPGVGPTG